MTNDIKLVVSLQYIQNAIDNIELSDIDFNNKNSLYYHLTSCKQILIGTLNND